MRVYRTSRRAQVEDSLEADINSEEVNWEENNPEGVDSLEGDDNMPREVNPGGAARPMPETQVVTSRQKLLLGIVLGVVALPLLPIAVVTFVFYTSARLTIGDDKDVSLGVPDFYTGNLTQFEHLLTGLAGFIIATIFGGIHCTAWSSDFPTHVEGLLWRIASLAITCSPALIYIFPLLQMYKTYRFEISVHGEIILIMISVISAIFVILCSICYLFGRSLLLVLPFMSLRALPIEAYQNVVWTSFIPHV